MPKQPEPISLRLRVSPTLYAEIGEFRHERRFETRAQALLCIVNAGLRALRQPPAIPPAMTEPVTLPPETSAPIGAKVKPARSKRLVAYAGAEGNAKAAQQW
jgi:hypothetical protein